MTSANQEAEAKSEERRIFICYPRSLVNDVRVFHGTLQERLQTFSRKYLIFRDKGPDIRERIKASENWRQVVREKLESSQCCLLVLVPAIFESSECANEVEYFAELIKRDSSRFFYPIMFVRLDGADAIAEHHKSGHPIAHILEEQHLDIYDFTRGWSEPDKNIYRDKLHEIAEELHDRFTSLSLKARKPPDESPDGFESPGKVMAGRERPPKPGAWRRLLLWLAPILLATAIAFGWIYWPPAEPPDFTPVSAAITLLTPVEAFAQPSRAAANAPELGPGTLTPGQDGIIHVREATIDGVVWYEVEFDTGEKRYLPKQSLPDWQQADPNLEAVGTIETFKAPRVGAEQAGTLEPGGIADSYVDGPLMQADFDGETWYGIPRREGETIVYVFFSAEANSAKLVRWIPIQDCLKTTRSVSAAYQPVLGENDAGDFSKEEQIGGEIQSGNIAGQMWFRFRGSESDPYRYLQADVVEQVSCGTD